MRRYRLVKRVLAVAVLVLLLALSTAPVAFADREDERERGRRVPEGPIALLYPLGGAATYGAYRLLALRKTRRVRVQRASLRLQ